MVEKDSIYCKTVLRRSIHANMSGPTLWERVKSGGKTGFDKTWKAMDKLGAPVNKLSNKLGSEAFWPTTMDKESDKAARILRSFCSECD